MTPEARDKESNGEKYYYLDTELTTSGYFPVFLSAFLL